jgi:ABC-type lipoprotein release transport system permease subunit
MRIPLVYNLRNLQVRWVSSMMAALGIGLVVMVFVIILALARGFQRALVETGSPDNVIVLRQGSVSEITSYITRDVEAAIRAWPGIARGPEGRPLSTADLVVVINHPRKGGKSGSHTNVTVRGVAPSVLDVRTDVRIAEGRMFTPGLDEIVVGRSISGRMANLELGDTVSFARRDWKVVGLIDAGGSAFESEIWGDVEQFLPLFQRDGFQSVTFRLADPGAFEAAKTALESDPRLKVEVRRESEYYAGQSRELVRVIQSLGVFLTVIMSIGAISGALNTMYATVAARTREIGTLLALGFRPGRIVLSFVIESVLLSAAGGLIGLFLSAPIHGQTTGTMNWGSFSEMSFDFRVTPAILAAGMIFAILMGLIGGYWPARKAARQPIATSIRSA